MGSESIQAHDGIPKAIARDFSNILGKYLPGWSVNGEYNLRASASTQKAAVQLEQMMHSGSHPWINNQIRGLLTGFEQKFAPEVRSERLAQLVNFVHESQNLNNLSSGGKTGGYVAFTSQTDPYWLDYQAKYPEFSGEGGITKYHEQFLDWDVIENSQAGKDIANLGVTRVPDGVDAEGNQKFKLSYDGKVDNGGFFSKTSDKLGEFKKPGSSKFSADWAANEGIKKLPDGSITKNGVAVRLEIADDFVSQKLPDGTLISSHEKVPSKLFSLLRKIGPVALLASVSVFALGAAEAQGKENYDSDRPAEANKSFISELIALTVGELAGLVAGALSGIVSFGLATIPVAIAVSEVAERFGRYLGELFYDTYTDAANAAAEYLAPLLSGIGEVVVDVAAVLYNFTAQVFDFVSDAIFGREGLFGLEGPLFGEGGPLQIASQFFFDQVLLPDSGEWSYDGFDALLEGTDADDVLIHDGWGEARGGKGDDILIGWQPGFRAKDDPLFDIDDSPLAIKEERLHLFGEEGVDWLIALGGTGAVLVGGEGRDFLFNTSFKGQLYGDTIDGVGQSTSGREDSDVFWYWPSTFIMDAQPNDILQLFGWPLLGGSNSVAGIYAGDGSLAIDWLNWTVFYGATKSGQLLVINAVAAALGIGAREGDDFPAGVMVVEDYDFGGWEAEEWGRPAAGDLGLTFRIAANRDDSVEISLWKFVWGHLLTFIDVMWNLTKLLRWQPVDDPLVLDLDGDGIETVSQSQSGVHFDLDGDYFREQTGWVGADDGFLVIDRNGNGVIDDIAEMFGDAANDNRFEITNVEAA